jgi:DNA repair protein RadC
MIAPSKEPTISDWATCDGPRDRLLKREPRYLSNVDLLATLIGPGNARCNGLELARRVLASAKGRLSELSKKSIPELMQIPGIGRAKASAIFAFAELSRRRQAEEGLERFHAKDTASTAAFIRPLLRDLDHEEFAVLFLDQANRVINFEIVSVGGITATFVDPRLICKKALLYNAVSIIVAHNRPSGQVRPSRADEILTQRIADGAKYLDIKLHDHIIVGEDGYFSFAAEGMLP